MKMIKSLKLAALGLGLTCSAATLSAQKDRTMLSSYLMLDVPDKQAKKALRCVLLGTNKEGFLFYKDNIRSAKIYKQKIKSYPGIWVFEPRDVRDAKNLFEDRNYKEALDAFKVIQKKYNDFKYLNDSYFEIAQYYEMECYRKLNDFKSLSKKLEVYRPDRLTRPGVVAQTKLYRMYDAVHKKDWGRLKTMCYDNVKDPSLTLSQRAQIAFCLGQAYEGLKEYNDALNAYATAMTSDFNRSESIVRESALRSLGIFATDEEVIVAMDLWKSADEDKNSAGYRKLGEANSLSRLYETAGLGFGQALPANYKKFQEFTTDEMALKLKERAEKETEDDIDAAAEIGVDNKPEDEAKK